MKKYNQFIKESKNDLTLEEQWFDAIINKDIDKVKELVSKGIDINIQDGIGHTGLMETLFGYDDKSKAITKYLLSLPELDINVQDHIGYTFHMIMLNNQFLSVNYTKEIFNRPENNVNLQNDQGETSLIIFSKNYKDKDKNTLLLFLKHPDIDLTITDKKGKNFLDYLQVKSSIDWGDLWTEKDRDISFLIDYDLQKEIIKNDEKNILVFNKYGLVHPKIKEEYSSLFKAAGWGLFNV